MEETGAEQVLRLTQHSHGAGCGCKIAPAVLKQILDSVQPGIQDPRLWVGNAHMDDAAVYDLGNGSALVSTTDFFTPIVDDPTLFGKIAAANALSDVYAMGGKPLMALAILGWPVGKLPETAAAAVMDGGRSICTRAGIAIAGGHSIDSPEPFFGLAVTGLLQAENLRQNHTAQEGDLLFLTKPLGTGLASTALKRGAAHEYEISHAWESMCLLNDLGAELAMHAAVTAMTDVTGFGLLGHLLEMCDNGRLGAHLYWDRLPLLPDTERWAAAMMVPDAAWRNWNAYAPHLAQQATALQMLVLADPQTNGGLLFSVNPDGAEALLTTLHDRLPACALQPIGRMNGSGTISWE